MKRIELGHSGRNITVYGAPFGAAGFFDAPRFYFYIFYLGEPLPAGERRS